MNESTDLYTEDVGVGKFGCTIQFGYRIPRIC